MTLRALAAVALAAASTLAAVGPAVAGQDSYETRSINVRTTGLDLASADGLAELRSRVDAAARRVCAQSGASTLSGQIASADCREQAAKAARIQIAAAIENDRRVAVAMAVR